MAASCRATSNRVHGLMDEWIDGWMLTIRYEPGVLWGTHTFSSSELQPFVCLLSSRQCVICICVISKSNLQSPFIIVLLSVFCSCAAMTSVEQELDVVRGAIVALICQEGSRFI